MTRPRCCKELAPGWAVDPRYPEFAVQPGLECLGTTEHPGTTVEAIDWYGPPLMDGSYLAVYRDSRSTQIWGHYVKLDKIDNAYRLITMEFFTKLGLA